MTNDDFYPEKPVLEERKPRKNVALTIFSIVLFVSTFLFLFTDEIFFVFSVLIVLIVHEMGHFLLMKRFGYKDVYMLFIPLMGAFVQGKKDVYKQKESIWVVIAGPVPGIIIGLFLLYLSSRYQQSWILELGLMFLLLNWINLLPLDPLDGGQLFSQLIQRNQAFFSFVFSFISSLLLIGTGWYIESFGLIVFGLVMGFRVRNLQKQFELQKEMDAQGINYTQSYSQLTNREYALIKDLVISTSKALRTFVEAVDPEESKPVVAEQVNGVLIAPVLTDAKVIFKLLILVTWVLCIISPFILVYLYSDSIPKDYEWYFKVISGQ
jgi:Zn-dependent protease